jgi:hypothetical protein
MSLCQDMGFTQLGHNPRSERPKEANPTKRA